MKLLVVFILALTLTTFLSAQGKPEWKELDLKGKVKSVEHLENYRYLKDGKFTEWEILYNKKYNFDNTGHYTDYTELKKDGSLYYKVIYTYNAKDKKRELQYLGGDSKPTSKKIWSFNAKNQLVEIQFLTKDGAPDGRYTYAYDEKGNNTMLTSYKKEGGIYSITTYTYDAKGNKVSKLVETPGYANSSESYQYDEKGNLTEEKWYDNDNKVKFRFIRSYDDKGNKIEELKYMGQDQLRDKQTWKYVYDSKGNWIKRTQYTSDGVEYDIADRKIVYY